MAKIRLRYIDTFKDRHGQVRYYFRRGKGARIPLPGQLGSREFMDAYAEALGGVSRLKATPGAAGTIGALVNAYMKSPHFTGLADVTQENYGRVLETLRKAAGERSAAGFQAQHAEDLLSQVLASNGVHPAYSLWRVLRNLMKFAKEDRWRADNPMLKVEAPKRKLIKGYRTASVAELEQFRKFYPYGTKARLAFELLFNTAARRADVVRIGRQNIEGDWITYTQQKTGAELRLPILPELKAAIDAMPADNLTLIVTEYGSPFTPNGFTGWFKDKCKAAGLPASTSPHSLRKAVLTQMADNGATAHELQAVAGHQNISESQTYTRKADQKRLAASGLEKVSAGVKIERPGPTPPNRVGKNGRR